MISACIYLRVCVCEPQSIVPINTFLESSLSTVRINSLNEMRDEMMDLIVANDNSLRKDS